MEGAVTSGQQLWVLSPPQHVSHVKSLLRQSGCYDASYRIIKEAEAIHRDFQVLLTSEPPPSLSPSLIAIPTKVYGSSGTSSSINHLHRLFHSEGPLAESLLLATVRAADSTQHDMFNKSSEVPFKSANLLTRTVHEWLINLPSDLRHAQPSIETLMAGSWRFHRYAPLLILPSGTFTRREWSETLARLPQSHTDSLYTQVAAALDVTHVAEQGAIPRLASSSADSATAVDVPSENILRAPLALRPLYGPFGSWEQPSSEAFARALWVTVRQHGIAQEFAPLYSMFANGNVGEKHRLVQIARASRASEPEAAVDLYAGIGYFAFSLVKAGFQPVLCWELNGWSLEGMRRGAGRNGWTARDMVDSVKQADRDEEAGNKEADNCMDYLSDSPSSQNLLLFHETNAHALQRISTLRSHLPPIRHVSCGYLPSSATSWEDAVRILDPDRGGWVHAHENCAVGDIGGRASQVEALFQQVVDQLGGSRRARCEHVERVKTYAPGVMHCVFDVRIEGIGRGRE